MVSIFLNCIGLVVLFLLKIMFQFPYISIKQVKKNFGNQAEAFFVLLTAVQFHLLFYSSRPLPNTFALALGECTV
jgi:alpha-1,6-mannosyltransferase